MEVVGAAETAVLRHHGSGDQTSTHNGETADGSIHCSPVRCGCGAAVLPGVPGILSHTAGLEASATSGPPASRLALANPTVALRLVVHDLVHGGFLARTLRDRSRLLRRVASTPPPSATWTRPRDGSWTVSTSCCVNTGRRGRSRSRAARLPPRSRSQPETATEPRRRSARRRSTAIRAIWRQCH